MAQLQAQHEGIEWHASWGLVAHLWGTNCMSHDVITAAPNLWWQQLWAKHNMHVSWPT